MNRRILLMISILLACLALGACQQEASDKQLIMAELGGQNVLIHNAYIYTADATNTSIPNGAMVFSKNGEILAIGSSQTLLDSYPKAEKLDAKGQTILPGLIDAHGHLAGPGGYAASLTRANLVGTSSKEDVLEKLREFETSLATDDWLLGFGWDQNDWPVTEFPTRQDLDREFSHRPVWLMRIDGHAAWGNSRALALADRDFSGTWNPEGGLIHRDADGEATGVFIDHARSLVEDIIPPVSTERFDAALDQALQDLLSVGLTGVHDAGLNRTAVQGLQNRITANQLPVRVYAMADGMGSTLDWLCKSGPLEDVSGRLFMRSVKLYADGALGSRGAALLADYTDEPGNRGLLFNADETMQDNVRRIMSCGLQVSIHAIGDAGNRQALDAYAALMAEFPHNPGRHRIEHVQVLALEDIPRLSALGIIASMQPTHATSDMYWAEERLGSTRVAGAYAWRSLLDSGARLALGSDFPIEQINPMLGIYAAVSRKDLVAWPAGGWYPAQRLSRQEAIKGFTLDAAYAGFMEDLVGSLEVGKRADFIVLDRNILLVAVEEIPLIRVVQTWVDGKMVYELRSAGLDAASTGFD